MLTRDDRIQIMLDEHEIRKIIFLYTRGVDRLDAELVSSVYHPTAMDNHGGFKGKGQDFGPYIAKMIAEHCTMSQHTLNQSLITVDGDKAHAETYFVAYHVRPDGDAEYMDRFGGRYIDKLARRDDLWKISDRVVVRDWSTTDKIEGSYYDPDIFTSGKRSKEDLAYGTP